MGMMFTVGEVNHMVEWAAQECEWQESGEKSVGRLVRATLRARGMMLEHGFVTVEDVLRLGGIIDRRNLQGFRTQVVIVGDHVIGWDGLAINVERWVEWVHDGIKDVDWTPTSAFKSFEEIHPFIDGNGRVGAILFNWLNGTLHPGKLVFPPNVFGDPRR